MAKFSDIKPFTRDANYRVDVPWNHIEQWLKNQDDGEITKLETDPDFQRAHVWDEEKQVNYVEYRLRNGMSAREIYWNCPNYQNPSRNKDTVIMVLVDGKQRLEAVRKFMRGELKVFGHYFHEFEDKPDYLSASFRMCVNDLETRAEVLQWYLDLNDGGVAHTKDELDKVRELLKAEA